MKRFTECNFMVALGLAIAVTATPLGVALSASDASAATPVKPVKPVKSVRETGTGAGASVGKSTPSAKKRNGGTSSARRGTAVTTVTADPPAYPLYEVCDTAAYVTEEPAYIIDFDGDPEEVLEEWVKAQRDIYPSEMSPGMVIDRVTDDGVYIIYWFICDEDRYDLSLLDKSRGEVVQSLLDQAVDDGVTRNEMRMMYNAERSVKIRYEGKSSGKRVDIVVPLSRMREVL